MGRAVKNSLEIIIKQVRLGGGFERGGGIGVAECLRTKHSMRIPGALNRLMKPQNDSQPPSKQWKMITRTAFVLVWREYAPVYNWCDIISLYCGSPVYDFSLDVNVLPFLLHFLFQLMSLMLVKLNCPVRDDYIFWLDLTWLDSTRLELGHLSDFGWVMLFSP